MWRRRNAFSENQDSDQSISEEEDGLDGDWTESTISMGGPADNKGGVHILSQLEILRDSHKLSQADIGPVSSPKRKKGFCIDDGVENHLFNNDDHCTRNPAIISACRSSKDIFYLPTMASVSVSHPDEETISDDEKVNPHILENSKDNKGGTWSKASREVEALIWLHENSGRSSSHSHGVSLRENKSSKGGSRTKAKPKFFIQSHVKDLPLVVNDGNEKTPLDNFAVPGEVEAIVDGEVDEVMAESQPPFYEDEYAQKENVIVQSEFTVQKHDSKNHSMTEFLDCFYERTALLEDITKRGSGSKMSLERITSPLGHESLDDDDDGDDLAVALDSGPPTPCHDEILLLQENPGSPKPNISRTMADKFHEALGTISVIDERPHFTLPRSSCGLFGKLQQVMQREKEIDIIYQSRCAETSSTDEKMCISVRIMSRSLEAKLTICSCTCIRDGENSHLENKAQITEKSVGNVSTIIFSPRICSDVDLEVGNLICIHPPWKEVQVKGKDEVIILCSYFSQIRS